MEKAHDISLDEPCVAHQAILFMLDVLMRHTSTSLTLDELYDSFGDKSFTPQMLRAVGGNEQGLRQFLTRYPSLFTVAGDTVSANSGGSQMPRMTGGTPERYLRNSKPRTKPSSSSSGNTITTTVNDETLSNGGVDLINSSSSSSSSSSTTPGLGSSSVDASSLPQYDSKTMKEIEQEAIAFFRKQISKREEDWLPIVSVAGHASQSSSDVRKFVGPQNEFKSFLVKYPHIFVVREEYCGLKGKADVSTQPFPPPSPPPKRRLPPSMNLLGGGIGISSLANTSGTGSVFNRTQSFKSTNRYSACGNLMPTASNSLTTSLINSQSLLNHAASNLSNNNLMNNIGNNTLYFINH
jgi:exonuclease 3'-5' domain-containing protein 1